MKCCSCCGPKLKYTILLLLGGILIALPIISRPYINKFIKNKIADNVQISNGSQIYDQWKAPTIPVYLQIYTLSIVNHLDFLAGETPFVVEKGPYSYAESRHKFNISWGDNNVSYNQQTNYTFDPTTSCATCDPYKDKIRTINIPYVTIVLKLSPLKNLPFFDEAVSLVMQYFGEGSILHKTVNDTIWGYDETLFETYDELWGLLVKLPFIGKYIREYVPRVPAVFALQPNPNYDGYTTVNTGQSDIDLVGCYQEWKGNVGHLNIWKSATANMLNGTDGSIYKPGISKDDTLYIFITQLCRSLNVNYLDEKTIRGIDGYRFKPPKKLFESGNINPNNKGFCNPNCLPSGLLSVNACVPFGAPIVVSSPHFLNGNKSLRKKVLGLVPNEEKHDTFLSLEPHTGILLRASKRLQFNIHVVPVSGFKDLEHLKESVHVPIMWINEHVEIDSDNADKLKTSVLIDLEIIKWVRIGLYILGGLMVLAAIILFVRLFCKSNHGTNMKLLAENGPNYGTNGDSGHYNPSLINASE